MPTPGQPSGTYLFQPSNAQVVLEAFDRIQIRPQALERHHFISARMSLNLELQTWSNRGFNYWELISGTLSPVIGQAGYALPATLMLLTELWWSQPSGGGPGVANDRWMEPITRTQYAQLPNKLQQGTPTQYWYQRLIPPQVQVYQTPSTGAPTYVMNWYGLGQIQDAGIATGEVPGITYQSYDALCAGLCARLAEKFAPPLHQAKIALAQAAWDLFASVDQEPGPMIMQPNFGIYGQMR